MRQRAAHFGRNLGFGDGFSVLGTFGLYLTHILCDVLNMRKTVAGLSVMCTLQASPPFPACVRACLAILRGCLAGPPTLAGSTSRPEHCEGERDSKRIRRAFHFRSFSRPRVCKSAI
jgi:hypothetical protein